MAIIYDIFGNNISSVDQNVGDVILDSRVPTQNIAAVNGVVGFDCANTNSVSIDIRGTFVATLVVEATINGSDFFSIPLFVTTTETFAVAITGVGSWVAHLPSGCKSVRVRCTAFTSGIAIVAMRGSQGDNFVYAKPIPVIASVTVTAASGVAATLTIPSGGNGLFHYITRIIIQRFATTLLTAGATPVLVTTTNMPGTRVFSIPADAAAQGTIYSEVVEPCQPLKSTAAATNTTIVAPLTTGVIWRLTADYYVGE